jgi:hypothetical protein
MKTAKDIKNTMVIDLFRKINPLSSDKDIARTIAEKDGYLLIIRYMSRGSATYDYFGCCSSLEEASGYINNPYCRNPEVIYSRGVIDKTAIGIKFADFDPDPLEKEKIGISFLVISKESVLEKNVSQFAGFVDSVSLEQLRSGRENYATAALSIDGYNDDPRPLWQISEAREWFKALHSVRPYAPYFLSPVSIQIYITCLEPFIPEWFPKECEARTRHPVVYLVSYAMVQFIDLLRKTLPDKTEFADRILNDANERIFSAMNHLIEGKAETL